MRLGLACNLSIPLWYNLQKEEDVASGSVEQSIFGTLDKAMFFGIMGSKLCDCV